MKRTNKQQVKAARSRTIMRLSTQALALLPIRFFFIEIYIYIANKAWVLKNSPAKRKVSPPKVRHKGTAARPLGQSLPPRRKTPRIPTVWCGGGGWGFAGSSRPAAAAQPIPIPIPSRVCRRRRGRPLSAPGCHRDRSADRATPTRRCLRADGLGGGSGAAGAGLPPRPLRPNNGGQGARYRAGSASDRPAAALCAGGSGARSAAVAPQRPHPAGGGWGGGGAAAGPSWNKEPETATWRLVCPCPAWGGRVGG